MNASDVDRGVQLSGSMLGGQSICIERGTPKEENQKSGRKKEETKRKLRNDKTVTEITKHKHTKLMHWCFLSKCFLQ